MIRLIMMEGLNMEKNKILIIVGTIILTLTITLVGISYSFFTNDIVNDGVNSTTNIISANLNVSYSGGKDIKIANITAEDSFIKTIKISNDSNLEMKYDISMENVVNTFNNQATLMYNLTRNDEAISTSYMLPSASGYSVDTYTIAPHEEVTYVLTIYVNDYNELIDNMSNFDATLVVRTLE